MQDGLATWQEEFFGARERADGLHGRPLYVYRLTDTEFGDLQKVLREKVGSVSSMAFLVEHDNHFAGLFVLYASEWWRRNYRGDRWCWEPILQALNIGIAWNSHQRGECVEKGLRYWRIGNAGTQGHRFLGAIARQGGLPTHLLETERGSLGRLLGDVIRLARGGNHPVDTLRSWVDSLKERLPGSYRTDEILDLLAEVVATVLDLARDVPEKDAAEALDWLNRNRPKWRERFPFPMDNQALKGMLGQLIQDAAARLPPGPKDKTVIVERRLVPKDDTTWALQSSVELPERIDTDDLVQLFGVDGQQSLTRSLIMSLQAGGVVHDIGLERLAGHGAYRLRFRPSLFSGADAVGEHFLRLTTAEGRVWNGLPRKGTALDADLPWLFAEEGSTWRFVRQGGGGIVSTQGIVAVPSGWSVTGDRSELIAFLESPERELHRFSGKMQICCPSSGRSWCVHSGDASAVETDWRWQGQQVWEEFVSPVIGFRNRPRLYDGNAVKPDLTWWTLPGQILAPAVYGPLEARHEVGGEIACRARMVILPDAARVDIHPQGPSSGLIRLIGWGAAGAEIDTQGLRAKVRDEDNALEIQLALEGDSQPVHPPEWIELSLVWPDNPQPARLRFPFPGKGARAFDGEGRELTQDSWLSIHRLAGVRLVAVGIESRLELRFTLRYPNEPLREGPSSFHTIQRPVGTSRVEIRLLDFSDTLERLLSAADLLDAWVEASISGNHKPLFKLRLSRYLCLLERATSNVALAQEGLKRIDASRLEAAPVLALRLESPGDDPVVLEPCRSEGVCTGAWAFVTLDREAGSWFIYPGAEAEDSELRPILWTLPGECATGNRLTQALAVPDRQERTTAVDDAIAALAADFLEPCWPDVERLAGHLGHLPLVSFDLWRRFAHSPAGMAALALRLNSFPDGFVRRFAVELPFVWELVPYRVWCDAAAQLREQCRDWFRDEVEAREFPRTLDSAMNHLCHENQALNNLSKIVRASLVGELPGELREMAGPQGVERIGRILFATDPSSLVQQLFQRLANHDESECRKRGLTDSEIFKQIQSASRDHEDLFYRQTDYRDGIINLPILLAIQVATDSTGDWFVHPERIHKLRSYRDFDPDWFEEAFDLTIARCLSRGLLKL